MTSDLVSPYQGESEPARELSPEQAAAAAMVAEAKARGLALTGPDGLLKLFTKNVLETALAEEVTEHLGHEKNRAESDRESTNVRNGSRPKTVISDAAGGVDINVPRDREGTFEPQIVKKRQRRLSDGDEIVLSLYAKGMTTGEISAHFGEICGASVSKETISRITDKVVTEMQEWANRPLDAVYAAVFVDAIHVKVREGQVTNRPVYAAIGVTLDGHKDVLGLWMGTGGEGAKFWMSVLIDLKNRGTRDVFFLIGDGLKGLPGRCGERVAANHRSDLHCSSHSEHLPPRLPSGLGRGETGHQTHLHRTQSRRGTGSVGRTRGEMGWQVRCHDPTLAQRLGGIRAVPRLRHRNKANDLLHQRDRIPQCSLSSGDPRPRTFPERAGSDEVPVPCHPQPGPHRHRPRSMDDALEASDQRVRHHVR